MRRNFADFRLKRKFAICSWNFAEFRRSSFSILLHSTVALKKINVKNIDGAHCQISQVWRICYIEHFPVYQRSGRHVLCDTHKLNLKHLRRNPSGNWVISIFSGQKPCTRITSTISHSFLHFFKGYRCNKLSVITPKNISLESPRK